MDAFLRFEMPFHVACAIAALVFGLGAMAFAPKRKWHKRFGIAAVAAILLLAITGLSFLPDLIFRNAIHRLMTEPGVIHDLFQDDLFIDVVFVAVAVITANGVITGMRVWPRLRASRGGQLANTWIDWTATLVTIPIVLAVTILSAQHFLHGNTAALVLLVIGVLSLMLQVADLMLLVRPPSVVGRKWWFFHMAKMQNAIGGIVLAAMIRHAQAMPPALVALISLSIRPLLLAVGWFQYRGQGMRKVRGLLAGQRA